MKTPLKRIIFLITLLVLTAGQAQAAWQQVGAAGFSIYRANWTSLALDSNDTPYIAYSDEAKDFKASVMKFDGNNWVQVGSAGFSPDWADWTSLALDGSGTPYIAYLDGGNSGKVSVMKFDGNNWVQVGAAGFSAGGAYYISFALDSNNTPYVAYEDWGNNSKASVMKFDFDGTSSSWQQVGTAEFSPGTADDISLILDSSNTPYIAYQDGANSDKASVMKFNGISWQQVGAAGFSTGEANYTSLALDNSDTPYIAYTDYRGYGNSANKANVMKFDGNNWVQVGTAGFSAGEAYGTNLALDSNGTPYIAYKDGANSDKESVMKFDGDNWVQVGAAGFSAGTVFSVTISLALDSNDTPYIGYKDNGNSGKASVMKFTADPPSVSAPALAPIYQLLLLKGK